MFLRIPYKFVATIAFLITAGSMACPVLGFAEESLPNDTGAAESVVIDDSWHLWLDEQADWKNDKLFLPDEVDLSKLPVNAPTGGWDALNDQAGMAVTLPATVEGFYWGKKPLPTADPNNPEQVVNLGSPYEGVSWWYRDFTAPALRPGERVVFHFPGAHLRAEVYVNGILVGYNMVSEIPFDADATSALKSGESNQIAVRITNPGGSFSWGDNETEKWGSYVFPVSKGFGGLSGGVTMAVHGPVAVDDLYVANNPDPHQVTLNAEVASSSPSYSYKGPVALSISRDGKEVWNGVANVDVPAGGKALVTQQVTVPTAELWDIGHPVLYRAAAVLANVPHSAWVTDFGFRWFNAEGIGTNPHLELNGRRIFVKSAISWGYWAPNGMFPDKEAVQREIDAVHTLGLNCVQSHRHFPKAAVLDGFDHAGLLRFCEPGGGGEEWEQPDVSDDSSRYDGPVNTSGDGGAPSSFCNRYELTKILAMVHAYRSHPSAIMWSLQNEVASHLGNPMLFYLIRQVHEMDPSRIVVLKSGYGPEGEIMGRPYSTDMFYGKSDTHNDSGWHDNHNEDDTGVYQDSLYKSPTDFKTYTTDSTGIAMWGELGTADSPDDDAQTVKWYQDKNIPGYNRAAAEARLAAYEAFIDKYQFRLAFPTASALFQGVGARHYFDAAHIIENARIADANDFIALTGWEATTVDNNSGLVDALRHLKANPALISQATAPELLVIHARHYVVAKGDSATSDAFIVNETNRHGDFTLRFTAAMDSDKNHPFFDVSYPVSVTGGQVFGQLLKDGISFTPPAAGAVTMTAYLLPAGASVPVLVRTEPLQVVDPHPAPLQGTIACADFGGTLIPALQKQFGIQAVPLDSAPSKVDIIIFDSAGARLTSLNLDNGQRTSNVENTDDSGLYSEEATAKQGDMDWYEGLAPGDATVELFFTETYFDHAGNRVFDVALNGNVVLHNFDIYADASGKNKAVVKKFTVHCPDGKLNISIPQTETDQPEIAAVRITDAQGKVIRTVYRRTSYQSSSGDTWQPAHPVGFDWEKMIPSVLDRVRDGTRLVLLGKNPRDMAEAAKVLDANKILTFGGLSGYDDCPWIGHWYFGRKHWLLDGLPSDCVLDWQYQAAAPGDGLILDAPGMEGVIGYGKNPGPSLGFGAVVIPVGQGQIVLLGMGGLSDAFISGDPTGFNPITATRIVYNALHR
jgi:beta-galactosidase